VLGDFKEEDVSYDDVDAKIYLGIEGEVTYNLSKEEFTDYAYESYHDDWALDTLMSYNGDYHGQYHGGGDFDHDEINYMYDYLNGDQEDRLRKILNYYTTSPKHRGEVISDDDYMNYNFANLEEPLLHLYRGRHDWNDFESEALNSLSVAVDRGRWESIGEQYRNLLDSNNVSIAVDNDEVQVTLPFPFKDGNNLSLALHNIGLSDYSWGDDFYESWDIGDADDEIREHFERMLEKIEEEIDEETNS
jgi:hypothetical protein